MYYRWLGVISIAVMYNLVLIIARAVFWKLQDGYLVFWIIMDYICDIIYLIDMFVQVRTGKVLVAKNKKGQSGENDADFL